MVKELSRDAVNSKLDALKKADLIAAAKELTPLDETKPGLSFAVEIKGKLYPVRRLVRAATGLTSRFVGTREAVRTAKNIGLEVLVSGKAKAGKAKTGKPKVVKAAKTKAAKGGKKPGAKKADATAIAA